MQILNNVYQNVSNYWEKTPSNTVREMTISFVSNTVVASYLSTDLKTGIIAGTLSALATLIYGLVTPIFREANHNNTLTWNQEMARTGITFLATLGIASIVGQRSFFDTTHLVSMTIFYGLLNLIDDSRRAIHRTSAMFYLLSI